MDTKSNNNESSRNGTVITEGNYTALEFERQIAHSKGTIWKAITEPKELASWFNIKAIIDGRSGGWNDRLHQCPSRISYNRKDDDLGSPLCI